ncbi:hypothetical protein CDL12_05937 [Handroanthus impetiginosus]|uniref:Uncharacterized protein n=1 Tax=Handroanthus impetiginosus TaxID=429701 RepID=A0A2G9HV06_9LAMI|nr:hypothetical protein CDL12_05937 [Handroanthus impetiginosus]
MADPDQNSISTADTEVKTGGENGKEGTIDSVVKPSAEDVTLVAKPLVENVAHPSSHVVTEVEKEVEKLLLVSDPWASLKNLGSSLKETETLPPSAENIVRESHETVAEQGIAGLEENSRSTHTQGQPFVAVIASTWASWMNCCGLLDVPRPSDQ